MKVGFVGLGNQGGPIARRIARSGYDLVACDINPQALSAFDEPGAARSADPIATAKQVDVLCVCVRMDKDLVALAGDGALFAALGKGGVFIVHSTVDPGLCQQLADTAKTHDVDLLDAGVSGGGPAALAGELAIYVGGDKAAFERVRPLLESYGKSTFHLGPVGRGMEAKLLNNLVSIANYGMSAAILDLGERLNFDREQLRLALMTGSAQGYALRVVPGLLRPEGAVAIRELLSKDLDHAKMLAPGDDVALAALVPAAQALLARLSRAATEGG
ncbi:MAG: NAD(P)-dependent oxidoreductase [Rhodospirillaceae bacterium]|nr:MAG: NAD(P)-dependent oxidoreductase [Rhodospirillaceae bacterium]